MVRTDSRRAAADGSILTVDTRSDEPNAGSVVVVEASPAVGEDFQADVAALFGPFVVLPGEHGADEPDQGVAVGEDADDVGAAADLAVESFLRVVRPDLPPDGLGNAVKARVSVGRVTAPAPDARRWSWRGSSPRPVAQRRRQRRRCGCACGNRFRS